MGISYTKANVKWENSEMKSKRVIALYTHPGVSQNQTIVCAITSSSPRGVLLKGVDNWSDEDTDSMKDHYNTATDKDVQFIEHGVEGNPVFTGFDGVLLSNRPPSFQKLVADSFVNGVVSSNLDSAEMEFSPPVYELAGLIFENEGQTSAFLDNPSGFVEQSGLTFSAEEERLILEAADKKLEVGNVSDLAELGNSAGDGNTYLLLGSGVPDEAQLAWLQQSLSEFQEEYGFLPAYGGYVTEAALRSRVIIGPGVTEREVEYLRRNVGDLLDRRGVDGIGEPIGSLHEGFFVAD